MQKRRDGLLQDALEAPTYKICVMKQNTSTDKTFQTTRITNQPKTHHMQFRKNKSSFLKSYLHKSDDHKHPSPLCTLCKTDTHTHNTSSIIFVIPGYTLPIAKCFELHSIC